MFQSKSNHGTANENSARVKGNRCILKIYWILTIPLFLRGDKEQKAWLSSNLLGPHLMRIAADDLHIATPACHSCTLSTVYWQQCYYVVLWFCRLLRAALTLCLSWFLWNFWAAWCIWRVCDSTACVLVDATGVCCSFYLCVCLCVYTVTAHVCSVKHTALVLFIALVKADGFYFNALLLIFANSLPVTLGLMLP